MKTYAKMLILALDFSRKRVEKFLTAITQNRLLTTAAKKNTTAFIILNARKTSKTFLANPELRGS